MKPFIILFTCGFLPIIVNAQSFERWYGGMDSDDGRGIVQLHDSGFAILARSWSWSTGGSDILLLRTDKYGDTLWTKTYGGTSNEFTMGCIKITQDSGFIIAGNTYSYGPGTPTFFNWYVIRTDSNGDTLWTKTWGTASSNDELRHVLPTSDGNYLLSGSALISGTSKGLLLKIDSIGNTLWGDTLPSTATSRFTYACENAQQEYVVTGNSLAGDFNVVVRKYDAAGNMIINKSIDGGTAECGITIEPVPGSGYICSAVFGFNPSFDPWILRLDDNLDTLFTKIMDFSYNIAGNTAKEYSIYPSGNGFFICGSDSNKLMARKTDAALNTEWQQFYGGTMGESGLEGINTSDGGFALIGFTYSFGAGLADIYFVKTDSMGTILTGSSEITEDYKTFFGVYPNPFNDHITIMHMGNSAKITIYDITAKFLKEFILRDDEKGITLSDLKHGIYLLTSENKSGIYRKIIVKQ